MLRYFRGGGVAQVIVGAIVFTIILVFVIEFRAGSQGPTSSLKEQCAVKLGRCIDQKDYYAAFGVIVPRGVDAKGVKRLGLRRAVLEGLVERELLVAQAEKLGLGVGKDLLDAELEAGRAHVSLPAEQARPLSGQLGLCRLDPQRGCEPGADILVRQLRVRRTPTADFDYKLYEREIRVVANRGPREFREAQERELLAEQLRKLVRARVRVSDDEVEYLSQRAVIRSAILSRDWFAKFAIDTRQESVDSWAFEHRGEVDAAWTAAKEAWTDGCPLIREVVVPIPGMVLDDEKNPLRAKAEAARTRITSGEDFAAVAREVSGTPSAILGGSVGCLSKSYGLGGEDLLKAVEKLAPGAVSDVIETPAGYHVVKLEGKLAADRIEAEGRRHVALTLYTRFKADEAMHAFAAELLAAAKGGQKLEDAVRTLTEAKARALLPPRKKPSADEATSPAESSPDRPRFEISQEFSRNGDPLSDVSSKEPVATLAFDLAKPDAIHEKPIETANGLVLIQLKELTKPSADEKRDIARDLRIMKGDDALVRYLADLRRAAGEKLKVDMAFAEDKTMTSDGS